MTSCRTERNSPSCRWLYWSPEWRKPSRTMGAFPRALLIGLSPSFLSLTAA